MKNTTISTTRQIFTAQSLNGKLSLGSEKNAKRFQEWLINNPNKFLTIEPVEAKRTLSQNGYYWLYLGVIERETGNDANEMHEFFRRKLLLPVFQTTFGEEIKVPRSTTTLTKIEMSDYLDKICAKTGIKLPDPKEAGYITNY